MLRRGGMPSTLPLSIPEPRGCIRLDLQLAVYHRVRATGRRCGWVVVVRVPALLSRMVRGDCQDVKHYHYQIG